MLFSLARSVESRHLGGGGDIDAMSKDPLSRGTPFLWGTNWPCLGGSHMVLDSKNHVLETLGVDRKTS